MDYLDIIDFYSIFLLFIVLMCIIDKWNIKSDAKYANVVLCFKIGFIIATLILGGIEYSKEIEKVNYLNQLASESLYTRIAVVIWLSALAYLPVILELIWVFIRNKILPLKFKADVNPILMRVVIVLEVIAVLIVITGVILFPWTSKCSLFEVIVSGGLKSIVVIILVEIGMIISKKLENKDEEIGQF